MNAKYFLCKRFCYSHVFDLYFSRGKVYKIVEYNNVYFMHYKQVCLSFTDYTGFCEFVEHSCFEELLEDEAMIKDIIE